MDTESEECTYGDRLSELLSDILKCGGVFMERIHILRSKCLLREKVIKDLFGDIHIYCGSKMAEGTEILGSDIDLMIVLPDILAINSDSDFFDEKLNIFTMLMDDCSPGYTRLRVQRLNEEHIFPTSVLKKVGNSLFISSEEFLKISMSEISKNFPAALKLFHRHGPCKTAEIWDIDCDYTRGIQCHSWPVYGMEWIQRPRCKGWPSQCIIEEIASFPVHVVPVGDPRSSNASMQWRFSFNYAERKLFWNFNDTQIQCYVLLKSILKGKLKTLCSETHEKLSGYHMKNLIFWISEEYGLTIFTKKNLLHCLEICLKYYKDRISDSCLPHYFLRYRNLLADKLEFETRQLIQSKINEILEDVFPTIVDCSHFIMGGDRFLRFYGGSNKRFIYIVTALLHYELEKSPIYLKSILYTEFHQIFASLAYSTTFLNPLKLVELICNIKSETNLPENILPFMLDSAKSFCLLQLGMFTCQCFDADDPKEHFIKDAYKQFEQGKDFDELSGKLYFVTFELFNNDIDKAWSLLSPVLTHTKPFIFGERRSKMSFDNKNMLQFSNTDIHNIPFDSVRDEDISYCYEMVFPKYIVNFVPEPIKYELYLQLCDKKVIFSCVYHPVVYAFYLMFEITRKKGGQMSAKDEILSKMSRYIKEYKSDLDHYRANNLLGFCYNKCGQTEKAVSAYCESMREKPDKTNVAVYHLFITLFEYHKNNPTKK